MNDVTIATPEECAEFEKKYRAAAETLFDPLDSVENDLERDPCPHIRGAGRLTRHLLSSERDGTQTPLRSRPRSPIKAKPEKACKRPCKRL